MIFLFFRGMSCQISPTWLNWWEMLENHLIKLEQTLVAWTITFASLEMLSAFNILIKILHQKAEPKQGIPL